MDRLRLRFWVEAGSTLAGSVLAVLTLVWHDWLELLFRVDPDQHDGAAEWLIIAALLLITACSAALARREWSRASLAA